jgi:hypothetical protein
MHAAQLKLRSALARGWPNGRERAISISSRFVGKVRQAKSA